MEAAGRVMLGIAEVEKDAGRAGVLLQAEQVVPPFPSSLPCM